MKTNWFAIIDDEMSVQTRPAPTWRNTFAKAKAAALELARNTGHAHAIVQEDHSCSNTGFRTIAVQIGIKVGRTG